MGLLTVGLLDLRRGEGNLYQVTVPETGLPEGLTPGTPVAVTGLKARDWENEFNGPEAPRDCVPRGRGDPAGGLTMTDLSLWLEATGALAGAGGVGYAKVRAPRLYWSVVGLPVTWGRFTWSYRSTMEVCGLTVQPSGFRALHDPEPGPS